MPLKGGCDVAVSIIVEHKSHPDDGVMRQLLRYMAALYDENANGVLPVILFHGKEPWRKKKSFFEFEHAKLPEKYLSEFGCNLIGFDAIFVSLRDPAIQKRLIRLPHQVRLVIRAMTNIWDADWKELMDWIEESRRLPEERRNIWLRSLLIYFGKTAGIVKIRLIGEELRTKAPGDSYMQEVLEIWKDELPETMAEVYEKGVEMGVEMGMEKGMEKGAQNNAREVAVRMIQGGMSDQAVQEISKLTLQEIKELRNNS